MIGAVFKTLHSECCSLQTLTTNFWMLQDPEIAKIAKKNGKTAAQVLLQWGLQHGTSVIPKSSNPKHIKVNGNLSSFTDAVKRWTFEVPK